MSTITEEVSWQGETLKAKALLGYMRKLPQHPSKLRVFRHLAHLLFSTGIPVLGPAQTRLLVDADDWLTHQIICEGSYEPKSLALAMRLMDGGGTFLDVGSNIGFYTCTVGMLPGVDCVSVEPFAKVFMALRRNIARNSRINVKAFNVALSSSNSLQEIESPDANNLGKTRITSGASHPGCDSYYVSAVTLEDLLARAGTHEVKLLKIDVEGYEMEVFRGLDWSGRFRPRNIIVELNDLGLRNNQTKEDYLKFFDIYGYDLYTVEGVPYNMEDELPESNVWCRSR